jgi:hypothetical protein
MCPLNNLDIAKALVERSDKGIEDLAKQYKINAVLGQYHSGLEHTFLWIVDAEDPHLIEQFCVEAGVASFNAVKIVPLTTFSEVAERVRALHSL